MLQSGKIIYTTMRQNYITTRSQNLLYVKSVTKMWHFCSLHWLVGFLSLMENKPAVLPFTFCDKLISIFAVWCPRIVWIASPDHNRTTKETGPPNNKMLCIFLIRASLHIYASIQSCRREYGLICEKTRFQFPFYCSTWLRVKDKHRRWYSIVSIGACTGIH